MRYKNYLTKKVKIDGHFKKISLLILTPRRKREKTPCVLWLHGGGYATGMSAMAHFTRAAALAKRHGAVVVCPSYTLSGRAPYPAALMDCYAALLYIKNNAELLGIDESKIMVGGESAGGGLTAAICMLACDRGEVNIAFQMPLYPMIDNEDTPSSKDNHAPVWNTKRNHAAWKMYLGELYGGEVPCYAAPARREDYSKLPPAYTFVGDIEPFYCETLDYIEKLKQAGVSAKVDVYKDWFHAYDLFFPFSKKGRRAVRKFEEEFEFACKNYSAEQS